METNKVAADRTIGNDHLSIWMKYGALGKKYSCANMAQGFPDWEIPDFLKQSILSSISESSFNEDDQGITELNTELANYYKNIFNFPVEGDKNISVQFSATNILFNCSRAFLIDGDEVVTFEPFFDFYGGQAGLASCKLRASTLIPPKMRSFEELENFEGGQGDVWNIDFDDFESLFNDRTKLLILNTPHNPTGKVFSQEELLKVAAILKKWPQVVVLCDEVYEHLFYEGFSKLPRLANVSGMADRCISIVSAGKTFSITGVRLAWAVGAEELIEQLKKMNELNVGSIITFAYKFMAKSLKIANEPYEGYENYYEWLREKYRAIRKKFVISLAKLKNFRFWVPEGGYFIVADLTDKEVEHGKYVLEGDDAEGYTKDIDFILALFFEKKVLTIPCSHFYTNSKRGENLFRISFCKKQETIDKALELLGN